MKEIIIFYLGISMGLCLMDYLNVKNEVDLQMYRRSIFPSIVAILISPIVFPFYFANWLINKIKGWYL